MTDYKENVKKNSKKSVCVFFGAGAEISLGMTGGEQFAKTVLALGADEINDGVYQYYKAKNGDLNNWYPKYKLPADPYIKDKLLKASLRKEILENELSDKEKNTSKTSYEEEIKKKFNEIKDNDDERNKKINSYPSYMGILDEQFHTLIYPKALGPQIFWKVIDAYSRAYLFLAAKFFEEDGPIDYQKILDNPQMVLDKMKEYSAKKNDEPSYYREIRKMKEQINIKVATTNYTTLCQHISGLKPDEIAYVNGRFGLFENPRMLEIIDYSDTDNPPQTNSEDVYFPYIFVQSGVKPIVDKKQIEEYKKMIDFFDDADKIIIVGYRLNSDDNHINSVIRSSIIEGKKIIYLNYDKKTSHETIRKKLRIYDERNNLACIDIYNDDPIEKFREVLCSD